jgi:hypothetical protein
LHVAAIPTGPAYCRPITPVPPVGPVKGQPSDGDDAGQKLRAAQPAGIGSLLDIEA